MTTEVRLHLVNDPPVPGIHATTPAGLVTFGFDPDLNIAMGDAVDAMVGWMQQVYELDKPTALALASVVVRLRVTQVANDVWGVHAMLPKAAVR
jgi:acetamidase/formamidase